MLKTNSQRITVCGMLIAVGILLPFFSAHGMGIKGTVLLPMHIPVFLIGFLCGPMYGGLCGLIIPVLNSVLTGMPAFYPTLPCMSGELAIYGAVSGLLYEKTMLGRMKFGIYPAMLLSMVCGRLIYGAVFRMLMLANSDLQPYSILASVTVGIPGIIVQLLLVPCIVIAVHSSMLGKDKNAVLSALNLIKEGTATCVVIKGNTIIKTEYGRGIGPVIAMYESGILKDTYVVDKIIGKAAAQILTLGGAVGCYGEVMSYDAKNWLDSYKVKAEYGTLVDKISNHEGTGICPMEQTVKDISDPQESLAALKRKIAGLKTVD